VWQEDGHKHAMTVDVSLHEPNYPAAAPMTSPAAESKYAGLRWTSHRLLEAPGCLVLEHGAVVLIEWLPRRPNWMLTLQTQGL